MPGNFRKEDLRIIKTYRSLLNAMRILLNRRNFEKITVNDLCGEALISRVTFYSHFNDKYDLLKYWLESLKSDVQKEIKQTGNCEVAISSFIYKNSIIILNLLENANAEVLELLHNFICSIFYTAVDRKNTGNLNYNQVMLSNFFAGGMISLLKLYVKNKFEPDPKMVSVYLFQMIQVIIDWDSSHTDQPMSEVSLNELRNSIKERK